MAEIRTARFLMRSPTLLDAEAVTTIVNDPRIYETVGRIPPAQSVEETGKWILNAERGRALDTDHVYFVIEGSEIIGTVAAHRPATDQPFELGYWVAPSAWGRGVATEAAQTLIDWLNIRGQASLLTSGYFADNPASGRVLEKLGFTYTRTAPGFCLGRDREIEHIFVERKP